MAIRSGLFRSDGGDRKYKADFFASYFASFIANGVFPNPSTGMQVLSDGNLNINVSAGKGWINGYFIINDSVYPLTLDIADSVLNRIDRVVMRNNLLTRNIEIAVKKGLNGSDPVPPPLQRDADIYELGLADIRINAGAIQITQSDITDLRLNNELCGIVHGVVDQVDTTTIFNDYREWYEQITVERTEEYDQYFRDRQQDFDDFIQTIEGILSDDVAGNLLSLIQQNQRDIRTLVKIKTDTTVAASGWVLNGDFYEYTVNDNDVFSTSVVDVNIQLESLDNAKALLSASNSYDGYFKIYASSVPDFDLIVDYRITNEVI